MHYKIKELHKIITIISNEEGLSEHGQTLLEGYAVGLEAELASNTDIIDHVIVCTDENDCRCERMYGKPQIDCSSSKQVKC